MKKGVYRVYGKIPFIDLGIKLPRINFQVKNKWETFLTGIIMNCLERKRYKRFVNGKSYGYRYAPSKYSLCPTYFSLFGLVNIVRCAEILTDYPAKDETYRQSPFTENADKLCNFGMVDNRLVEVDYGDFTIYSHKIDSVTEIDYR